MKSELALKNVETKRFIFLLHPRFVMSDLMDAINWFKCANDIVDNILFEWVLCSVEGSVLLADNGMVLSALRQPSCDLKPDSILVFAGGDSHQPTALINRTWLSNQVLNRANIYQFQPSVNKIEEQELNASNLNEMMAEMVLPWLNEKQNKALLACVKPSNGLSLRVSDSRIHKALSLMRNNIETPLDSNSIANQSFISLRQLERLFKHYFNESPNRHYTKLRLKNAKELLLSTNLKVGDVSQACGFSTVPYFCKAYRDCFGITPLQSKEERQKQVHINRVSEQCH